MKTSKFALTAVVVIGVGAVVESRDFTVLDITHWHEKVVSLLEGQPTPSYSIAASGAIGGPPSRIVPLADDMSGGGLWFSG
jgi:hypothetical protein